MFSILKSTNTTEEIQCPVTITKRQIAVANKCVICLDLLKINSTEVFIVFFYYDNVKNLHLQFNEVYKMLTHLKNINTNICATYTKVKPYSHYKMKKSHAVYQQLGCDVARPHVILGVA
jgi:hypothetical protein